MQLSDHLSIESRVLFRVSFPKIDSKLKQLSDMDHGKEHVNQFTDAPKVAQELNQLSERGHEKEDVNQSTDAPKVV